MADSNGTSFLSPDERQSIKAAHYTRLELEAARKEIAGFRLKEEDLLSRVRTANLEIVRLQREIEQLNKRSDLYEKMVNELTEIRLKNLKLEDQLAMLHPLPMQQRSKGMVFFDGKTDEGFVQKTDAEQESPSPGNTK